MNLFDLIKKIIKILSINKDYVTIGTKKGFWSKGLEFGNKYRFLPLNTENKSNEFEKLKKKVHFEIKKIYAIKKANEESKE